MLVERKKYISRLTATLKNDYDTSDIKGLKQIAVDHRIVVIESPRIVVPLMSRDYPQPVIFTRKFVCPRAERWVFGHELGHAILHATGSTSSNEAESEANFFQEQLNGPIPYLCLMKDTLIRSMFPLHSLEYIFKVYFTDRPFMNILNKAYAEGIDKYYNEMNE